MSVLALLAALNTAPATLPPAAVGQVKGSLPVTAVAIQKSKLYVRRGRAMVTAYKLPALLALSGSHRMPRPRMLRPGGQLKGGGATATCRDRQGGGEIFAGKSSVIFHEKGKYVRLKVRNPGPTALSSRWLAVTRGTNVLVFQRDRLMAKWRPLRGKISSKCRDTVILKMLGAKGGDGPVVDSLMDGHSELADAFKAPTSVVKVKGTKNATLTRRLGALRSCHQRALKNVHSATGTLSVALSVTKQGRVSRLEIPKPPAVLKEVAACVRARIKTWRFPGDTGDLRFELVFRTTP